MSRYMFALLFFIAFCHLATIGWIIFKYPVDSLHYFTDNKPLPSWFWNHYKYYFHHLYFVVTTCTTIGYGDVVPYKDRNSELIFGMVVILAGLSIMSIVFNLTAILLNQFMEQSIKVHQKMKDFKYWFFTVERSAKVDLPHKFIKSLNSFFKALYNLEVDTVVYSDFYEQLPPKTSSDLEEKYHMAQDSPFESLVQRFGKELAFDIIKACEPLSFLKDTVILKRCEKATGIYWITFGKVKMVYHDQNSPVSVLQNGDSFGSFCLLEEPSRFTYVAEDTCMAHFLPEDKLRIIIEKNGNSGQAYENKIKRDFHLLLQERNIVKSLFKFRTSKFTKRKWRIERIFYLPLA
jgi:hypothetical protein